MSKKSKEKKIEKKFVIIFILLCVALVSLMGTMLFVVITESPEEKLAYINSNEMKEGTTSPKMIHAVITRYEGDLNPKAITKSTYNFINTIIPKYLNEIDSEEDAKKYYNNKSKDIYTEIGIGNEEDFIELYRVLSKLSGNLEVESSTFKLDEVEVKPGGTEANLYIKYLNNPEICIKIIISNNVLSGRTSIKYTI